MRANKLLAKAADALVRGEKWLANDVRTQEELELFRHSEIIQNVGMHNIKKAAAHGDDWRALEEDCGLTAWVVSTSKRCVRGVMISDANKFEVLRNVMWKK